MIIVTHEVRNQPPPLENFNAYSSDSVLQEAVAREGAAWIAERAEAFGARIGSREVLHWGELANEYVPRLRTHDRFGHRIDEVEYHPAYHQLMRLGIEAGLSSLAWTEQRRGAHTARAALFYMAAQAEAGTNCPITMTHAVVPSLRLQADVAAEWLPRVFAARYDERFLPAANKRGVVLGMAMTEKQGGSDVRSNSTTAKRLDGDTFELTGHKWFCSAPMCDAFLTLAQAAGGLTCFLVPRFRPDGTRNPLYVQRLKDKLGNRSNASSEIEYADTWAQRIGEEGRGVRTIIQMVHHTRLDCAMGSAGAMRMAVRQAVHHCSHREAFGKLLTAQPLMQNVLADIALEAEAATMLVMRLARAFDDSGRDASAKSFARVVTPVAKYWVCKRAPTQIAEALECLGGAGYVEESIMPRLYRDAPVNSIWEGSGNVQCLDVLRALHTHPDSLDALVDELGATRRADRRLDAAVAQLQQDLRATSELEARARRVVEKMALTLQASLLLQHAPSPVADAFCASRLDAHWGNEYGTLPSSTDFDAIISRARP